MVDCYRLPKAFEVQFKSLQIDENNGMTYFTQGYTYLFRNERLNKINVLSSKNKK